MLRVEHVDAGYGHLGVLRDVSMELELGEIVSIIGANGAGKSTLLKVISGLLPASAGSVRLGDADITRMAPHEIVRKGLVQVPENRQLFSELSVQDNLMLGAFAWARGGEARQNQLDRMLELFPILRQRAGQIAGTLSGGEQQMLAIGRALMGRPRILLLDEPSVGLAPLIVGSILEVIQQLRSSDLGVLLVEQNARAALGLSDRAYLLETGRIVAHGTGAQLLDDPQVQASYLGRV